MSSPGALPSSSTGIESILFHDFDCVVGVTAALLAVSAVAVALRVYVRSRITKTFGYDDATMVAAMLFWFLTATLTFVSTHAERLLVGGVVTMSSAKLVQVGLMYPFLFHTAHG